MVLIFAVDGGTTRSAITDRLLGGRLMTAFFPHSSPFFSFFFTISRSPFSILGRFSVPDGGRTRSARCCPPVGALMSLGEDEHRPDGGSPVTFDPRMTPEVRPSTSESAERSEVMSERLRLSLETPPPCSLLSSFVLSLHMAASGELFGASSNGSLRIVRLLSFTLIGGLFPPPSSETDEEPAESLFCCMPTALTPSGISVFVLVLATLM